MAHFPINHHLRPVYRVIAGLLGLYLAVFGIVGCVASHSLPFFAHDGMKHVLGMRANPAFSILSIIIGLVIIAGAVLGRNIDHFINMWIAGLLIAISTLMLALLRTELNLLGFSMVNVIVMYTIAMFLMAAGLYGKVGTSEEAVAEDHFQHAHY